MEDFHVNEVNEFWKEYNIKLGELKFQFENADSVASIRFAKIELNNLQKFSTNGSRILPLYDVKRTQEEVESLRSKLRKIEQKICPRRKFKFSNHDPSTSSSSSSLFGIKSKSRVDITEDILVEQQSIHLNPTTTTIIKPMGTLSISNREKEDIVVTLDDFPNLESKTSAQLFISECKAIVISAQCSLGSIRLENLIDCIIALGPCRTSIYLENCINCRIFMTCHQLRIHNSHKCQLFVLVNSAPIIEDCSQLEFAPNKVKYASQSNDQQECGLLGANHWDDVIDFRWHKSVASPHWRALLPMEYDRVILSPSLVHRGWSLIEKLSASSSHNVIQLSTTTSDKTKTTSANAVQIEHAAIDDDEDEM